MYNKTIIRFGFCDIQNNQGLVKGYQPQSSALADNPYLDLDYSRYHKKTHPIIKCNDFMIMINLLSSNILSPPFIHALHFCLRKTLNYFSNGFFELYSYEVVPSSDVKQNDQA